MNLSLSKEFKIHIEKPSNFGMYWGTILLCVSEGLPFVKSMPGPVRYGVLILYTVLFLLGFVNYKRLSSHVFIGATLVVIINLFLFFKIYSYVEITDYFIQVIRCWLFVLSGLYYASNGNEQEKKSIGIIIILISVITAITSIIILKDYPLAVRSMGNGAAARGFDVQFLYSHNTSTWGILYGMVFLLPTLVYRMKNSPRIITAIVIIVLEAFVIKAQVTFGILISFFFMVLFFLDFRTRARTYITYLLMIVVVLVTWTFLPDILLFIYNNITSFGGYDKLSTRVYEMYMLLQRSNIGDAAARSDLYSLSINTFLQHPIFGYYDGNNFSSIGYHSQIFDNLAGLGLIGFIPFSYVFITCLRKHYSLFDNEHEKRYLVNIYIMLFALMAVNPVYTCPTLFMAAFLFPSVFLNNSHKKSVLGQ